MDEWASAMTMVKETTTKQNLRSMEIYYLPVLNIQLGITQAYITQLRINDPKMGVIIDEAFMPVAERTVVTEKITAWLLDNLFNDIQRFRARGVQADWFGVYIPTRVLLKKDFLTELCKKVVEYNIRNSDICICLNNKVLYEDHVEIKSILSQAKIEGIKSLILDFGDDFCPVSRISDIKTDYVHLSESVTYSLNSKDEVKRNTALGLYHLLKSLDIEAITSNVKDNEASGNIPESCIMCTGKLAGNYRRPRSVR
jgi:EAL domain-containing protein (putative c-di-GMP-specific phosphodiesterase class I)